MKPETYNDVMYHISQAALYKITKSCVSISFLVENDSLVNILVYVLEEFSELEKQILLAFKTEIINRLSEYNVNFEYQEIPKDKFHTHGCKSIGYTSFLRRKEDV